MSPKEYDQINNLLKAARSAIFFASCVPNSHFYKIIEARWCIDQARLLLNFVKLMQPVNNIHLELINIEKDLDTTIEIIYNEYKAA